MNQLNFQEANARLRAISATLNDIAAQLDTPDLAEEKAKELRAQSATLQAEADTLRLRMNAAAFQTLAASEAAQPENKAEQLRSFLRDIVNGTQHQRDLTLFPQATDDKNNIQTANAIKLTIEDVLPNLSEGLIHDKVGMRIQQGVSGELIWPYALDNVTFSEKGENVPFTEGNINFGNVATEPKTVGATLLISNEAIDNAAFNVLSFVQQSFTLAMRNFINHKTFSHAAFTGLKGPWSGAAKATAIKPTYENILKAKAALTNSGIDMTGFCYVIDAETEATLKATPKGSIAGGYIIEDGLMAGDPYFVSHYIRETAANAQATDLYIGLGVWNYFALCQHGPLRLTVDPTSEAIKNAVRVTMSVQLSMTTLRPEAFALYKLDTKTT